jgi:AcrR family transcriptional regulator
VSTEVPDTERPKRADALRNRDRVLEAARIAFAQGGPDVAVSEILQIAGVGSGTLFRHFATKHDLLLAVLEQTFDDMADSVTAALAMDDPWAALAQVLSTTAEVQARDQAFLQSVGPELFGEGSLRARNELMMEQLGALVERAQRAGVVRSDLTAADLPFIISAIGGATQQCTPAAAGTSPDLWRRYLGFVLDGLRPEGAHPLAEPAPTLEQLMAIKAEKHAKD